MTHTGTALGGTFRFPIGSWGQIRGPGEGRIIGSDTQQVR